MGDVETVDELPVMIGSNPFTIQPIVTSDISFNSGTGVFTVLKTGIYRVIVQLIHSGVYNDSAIVVSVNVNGAIVLSQALDNNSRTNRMLVASLSLAEDDTVSFSTGSTVDFPVKINLGFDLTYEPYPTVYRLSVVYIYRVI